MATIDELRAEIQFRDKIIRKLELRILDKEEEIQQLRSDLDKVIHIIFIYSVKLHIIGIYFIVLLRS